MINRLANQLEKTKIKPKEAPTDAQSEDDEM